MAPSGKRLTHNIAKYGNSLINKEQEKAIRETNIAFSFEYYKEIDLFGVGHCDAKWHISIYDRLASLSCLTPKDILEDGRYKETLKCHAIDWSAKNIPIEKKSLNWLPHHVLDGDEFPIMQLSISKGTGRIIGFFDKDSFVFNIILFDPNHNLQPSNYSDYKMRPTLIGTSQYDDLLGKLIVIRDEMSKCPQTSCILNSHIDNIENTHNIIYVGLDADFYEQYIEIIKTHSLRDIVEEGIFKFMTE